MKRSDRLGFTLVELLVVIAIIGVLVGLLLPAVQMARESARRIQCASQMNQLSIAAISYEGTKKMLPGYLNYFGMWRGPGDPADPLNTVSPSSDGHYKIGSWHVSLMPYLEQQPTYERWNEDKYPLLSVGSPNTLPDGYHAYSAPNIPVFQCPSSTSDHVNGRNSYVSNNGMFDFGDPSVTPAISFVDISKKANGAFNNKFGGPSIGYPQASPVGAPVRLDDFKDGTSSTLLFTENIQAQPYHWLSLAVPPHAVLRDPASNLEIGLAQAFQGVVFHPQFDNTPPPGYLINSEKYTAQMTSDNAPMLARPSSGHVDGVNAAFADGSTRFLVETMDYRTYQAYLTLRGKSSDVAFKEFVPSAD